MIAASKISFLTLSFLTSLQSISSDAFPEKFISPGSMQTQIIAVYSPLLEALKDESVIENIGNCRFFEKRDPYNSLSFCITRTLKSSFVDEQVTIYGSQGNPLTSFSFIRYGANLAPSKNRDLFELQFPVNELVEKSNLSILGGSLSFYREYGKEGELELFYSSEDSNSFIRIVDREINKTQLRTIEYKMKQSPSVARLEISKKKNSSDLYFSSVDESKTLITPLAFQEKIQTSINRAMKELEKIVTQIMDDLLN